MHRQEADHFRRLSQRRRIISDDQGLSAESLVFLTAGSRIRRRAGNGSGGRFELAAIDGQLRLAGRTGNVTSFIGSFVSSSDSGFWQEVQTILIIVVIRAATTSTRPRLLFQPAAEPDRRSDGARGSLDWWRMPARYPW